MAKQITLEELLELVTVKQMPNGSWRIIGVYGTVYGDVRGEVRGFVGGDVGGTVYGTVYGDVRGNISGDVGGDVGGTVWGNVDGIVRGTITGKEWQYIETPKDKIKRLLEEGADKEQLLEAVSQMEDN